MKSDPGRVGPFFVIEGNVICDCVPQSEAQGGGTTRRWASTKELWGILYKSNRDFLEKTESHYLRGEVVFNMDFQIYEIRVHPALNEGKTLEKIIAKFQLEGLPSKLVLSKEFPLRSI